MVESGCQRHNRKCWKIFFPLYLDCIDGLIWKYHKEKKMRLVKLTKAISKCTGWDEMFTPAQLVRVLVARGFRFTREQRYYAISKVSTRRFILRGRGRRFWGRGDIIRQCVEWEVYRIFFRTLLSIR